jgi:hypothetical protein
VRGIKEVVDGAGEEKGIVLQVADAYIAVTTKQTTDFTGVMTVVDVEHSVSLGIRCPADGTAATLFLELLLIVGNVPAILPFVAFRPLDLRQVGLELEAGVGVLLLG